MFGVKNKKKKGIEKARAAKKYKGRTPKYTAEQRKEIYIKYEAGHISTVDLLKIYKISKSTLHRIISEYRLVEENLKEHDKNFIEV